MAFDTHSNLAYGTVLTAPSPATSGTSLVLNSGEGAAFGTAPFNITIWPTGVNPTSANAEIARCTNRSTDTLTITRTQEGSTNRSVIVGDQVALTVTKKSLTDIEAVLTGDSSLTNPPSFRAYPTSDQNLTTDDFTKIVTDTEDFDTNGNWDLSNDRFTAPFAGKYFFHCTILYSNMSGADEVEIWFKKNGSTYVGRSKLNGIAAPKGAGEASIILNLAQSDYIEFWALTVGASTVVGHASGRDSWLEGFWIGP